jgi:hypothetical protein
MAGRGLSGEARVPLVSINIPCYNQLPLARRAVECVLAQSFTNIEVILHDDGASIEYERYVESLHDSRVRYQRNGERLGAMRNMFAAIESGRGKYTMSFHEDDLLGSEYIAAAVAILEGHPTCGLVACDLREFEQEPSVDELTKPAPQPAFDMFGSGAEFVRGILRGVEPMFGSVVYRREALEHVRPHHEAYATLADRPYLLSIVKRGWTAAVIREPPSRAIEQGGPSAVPLIHGLLALRAVSPDAASRTATGLALPLQSLAHGAVRSTRAGPVRSTASPAGRAQSTVLNGA